MSVPASGCGSPRGGWPPAGRGRAARPPPAPVLPRLDASSCSRALVLVRQHVGVEIHAVTVCGAPAASSRVRKPAGCAHRPTYDDPVSGATVGVGDDDFVTGEAVALDLPPASIGSRMLSGFLDYLIVWVVTFTLVSSGAALSRQLDDALVAATVLVCFLVAWLAATVTIETLTRGRSLGKMAAGLRTVRDDAGPITFRRVHPWAAGRRRGLHAVGHSRRDRLDPQQEGQAARRHARGTYVVRDRVTAQLPPPVPMPPQPGQLGVPRRHHPAPRRPRDGGADLPPRRPVHDAARPRRDGAQAAGGDEPLRLAPTSAGQPPSTSSPRSWPTGAAAAVRLARDTALRQRLTAPDRIG